MTTQQIVDNILRDYTHVYQFVKNLAPQNSKYRSVDRGKPVNYIYVNNERVYTNTGNLHNSVMNSIDYSGNTITSRIYVDRGSVPYYEKAVLSPTIVYAKHRGRQEYGMVRYASSRLVTKKNRNYLYYMRGALEASAVIGAWNGLEFNVTDDIENYMG